ncbi:MAB_1171c family putative transporter [Nocardia sp. NPDC127526]|uniref:MAB_1171c family putative transporter n=1 Tax=Nocardia sp. NPDC127526 TaxID=3345393 RepID=UPI003627D364
MTSAVPGVIAWPALIVSALIILGRYRLLNDSPVDKLINHALVAGYSGLLLREAWFEKLVAAALPIDDAYTIQFLRQLSFGSIVWSIAGVYGIVKLWGGADPATTWQRQRIYNLVAAGATVVILLAGFPALRADQLIDQYMGWNAVIAWVAFYAPIGATAVLLIRVAYKELRAPDTTLRERALYVAIVGGGAIIGLDCIATPIITAAEVLADKPSRDPDMSTKSWIFFLANVGASAAVALPLISTVLTVTGWDRIGRYCRALYPLWRDLTAAVPEIVLELPRDARGRVEPATRLHRMIVEIRDALRQLRRYGPDIPATPGTDMDTYARHVAAAIAAKHSGAAPTAAAPATTVQLGTRDLTGELGQLVALAKAWPRAKQAH